MYYALYKNGIMPFNNFFTSFIVLLFDLIENTLKFH